MIKYNTKKVPFTKNKMQITFYFLWNDKMKKFGKEFTQYYNYY